MVTPFLREEKRVKRRERPEVKNTTIFTLFWGLKNWQEVVPKAFPGKVGGGHFLDKAMLERSQKQRKMITVLGVFEFDAFLAVFLASVKRGVGGGGGEAPTKR